MLSGFLIGDEVLVYVDLGRPSEVTLARPPALKAGLNVPDGIVE